MKRELIAICLIMAMVGIFGVTGINYIASPLKENQGLTYKSQVCIYVNGNLHECGENTLYNDGADLIKTILGDTGTGGPVKLISLCNASAGCQTPTAAGTEDYNPFTTSGLNNQTGTYASVTTGNWTITKTFTAGEDNMKTNVTRLLNDKETKLAGKAFTLVTLQTNDQIQVQWNIAVS